MQPKDLDADPDFYAGIPLSAKSRIGIYGSSARAELERQKEHLLEQKLDNDSKISELNIQIAAAAERYNKTGKGVRPDVRYGWLNEIAVRKRKSQELQLEIGKLSKLIKASRVREFERVFVELAKKKLAPELFDEILEAALKHCDAQRREEL